MNAITISVHDKPITEHMYEFFLNSVVPTIQAIGVAIASIPAGQWVITTTDYWLGIVIEALTWSAKNNNRSVTWFVFIPMLMTVQYLRVIAGIVLFIVWGKSVSSEEMKEYIDITRAALQDMTLKGQDKHNAAVLKAAAEGTKHNLLVATMLRILAVWPMRPMTNMVASALYFFGLTYTLPKMEKISESDSDSGTEGNNPNPDAGEQHQGEHHEGHHEGHHEEHHEHHHHQEY